MAKPYAGPAMTIDNMRALGVPSLDVTCQCGREVIVDASHLSGLIEIPTLRRRFSARNALAALSTCGRTGASTARRAEDDTSQACRASVPP
jgi:hypothetical protein